MSFIDNDNYKKILEEDESNIAIESIIDRLRRAWKEFNRKPKFGRFKLYEHKKPNGDLFLIGEGEGNRPYSKEGRTKEWHKIVNGFPEGFDYVNIVEDNLAKKTGQLLEGIAIWVVGIKNLAQKNKGNLPIRMECGDIVEYFADYVEAGEWIRFHPNSSCNAKLNKDGGVPSGASGNIQQYLQGTTPTAFSIKFGNNDIKCHWQYLYDYERQV